MNASPECIARWIADRVHLPRVDGQYLVDKGAVAELVAVMLRELAANGLSVADTDKSAVRSVLSSFLLDERDRHRALIGKFSVELSPVNVAGAVIAALSVISWALSDPAFLSPGAGLTAATVIQSALSAVSRLAPEERNVVSLILSMSRVAPDRPVTVQTLVATQQDPKFTPVVAARILSLLRHKGAISWSGEDDAEIHVKKWY